MARYHLIGAMDDSDFSARGIEHEVFDTEPELYAKLAEWEDRSIEYAVISGDEVAIDVDRVKTIYQARREERHRRYREIEGERERELYEKLKAKYGG